MKKQGSYYYDDMIGTSWYRWSNDRHTMVHMMTLLAHHGTHDDMIGTPLYIWWHDLYYIVHMKTWLVQRGTHAAMLRMMI